MRISYKIILSTFFILYILPLLATGVFVKYRIQDRQPALQVFLSKQVDTDRKIVDIRRKIENVQPEVRNFVFGDNFSENNVKRLQRFSDDNVRDLENFWGKYQRNLSAQDLLLLQKILAETKELNLIDEETNSVIAIKRGITEYFDAINNYIKKDNFTTIGNRNPLGFLNELDSLRTTLFNSLDQLADIRYIFAQRVVFFINGENDRELGFFTALFIFLVTFMFLISAMEYFYIHRLFRDIMDFLKETSLGRRGQRIYFSTPVKEIKATEDVINKVIDIAEKHEQEKDSKSK